MILSKEPSADFKEVGGHFITIFKRKDADNVLKKVTEKVLEKVTESQKKILGRLSVNKMNTLHFKK